MSDGKSAAARPKSIREQQAGASFHGMPGRWPASSDAGQYVRDGKSLQSEAAVEDARPSASRGIPKRRASMTDESRTDSATVGGKETSQEDVGANIQRIQNRYIELEKYRDELVVLYSARKTLRDLIKDASLEARRQGNAGFDNKIEEQWTQCISLANICVTSMETVLAKVDRDLHDLLQAELAIITGLA
ncbi:Hypothetical predicted protein [Lecanosticta acicola]|uniref:Uncharacterized protein n=1 Tax=Lecanosticta acicola TaxID=111012 RepID=A0AAI9EG16_9PEZI|nr:Hypothetical predicted protein [Lecanosticta acicola]